MKDVSSVCLNVKEVFCHPAAQYHRRRRTALWVTISLLTLGLLVLTVGLISATRTDNVTVVGLYPGIILSFGAFLGIVGIHLVENRRPMLVSSIIFISVGVIVACFCAIVDGIIASDFILQVMCHSFEKSCKLTVKSNTCYCCYLYNCESRYSSHYYDFTGVSSCWDVVQLYRLMWTSVVLNVIGLFLGIITAAILGAYKDIVHNTNHQAPATPQMLPPGGGPVSSPSSCPSEENQSQLPSQVLPQPQPQGATQDPGGYMLTPNAPVLYASSYSAFEKPPPYAC
uniref:Transmembrane protein 255B n=1 Tax=Neolamprologus brichardi TaxID=32507 RepID=A0A3Q4N0A5_NEOBR